MRLKHMSTGGDGVSFGEDASSPLTYHMLNPTLVDSLLWTVCVLFYPASSFSKLNPVQPKTTSLKW